MVLMGKHKEKPKQSAAHDDAERQLQEANTCLALGAGIGALGTGSALLAGAVCPVCYVVVPGLVAAGLIGRHRAKRCTESSLNTKHSDNHISQFFS